MLPAQTAHRGREGGGAVNRFEMFCFIVGALTGIWMTALWGNETTSVVMSAWAATGAVLLAAIIWFVADVIDKRLTKKKEAAGQ